MFNADPQPVPQQSRTDMKPQVLQLNPILIPAVNDELASRYQVHKFFEIPDQAAWLREHGAGIEAVITGGHTGISRAMLEQLPGVKVVAVNGVGTDAVDLAYCRARALPVTATLGALTEDVADLAIGLLIAACRNLCAGDRFVREGLWEQFPSPSAIPLARRFSGMRVGIVGMGRVGRAVATRAAAAHLGKPEPSTSLVALHLGSGASACAVRSGRSADTSMGLTPLAGLPGATRSGTLDPSLVFHYASDVGRLSPASTSHLHISLAEEILNKRAGWSALAGTTDFAAITSAAQDPKSNPQAALAFDLFVDRVSAFVGSYFVSLRGEVDALVFAGGIGEKSPRLRAAVVDQVSCLGFTLDPSRNDADGPDDGSTVWDIGAPGSAHRVLVCRTDEQYEMARDGVSREDVWSSSPSSLPSSSTT